MSSTRNAQLSQLDLVVDTVDTIDTVDMVCTVDTRAHNLCHDNCQLIVIAINRNHSAAKNNRN